MNDNFIFPRWLCAILSYLNAFLLGGYCYKIKTGGSVEWYEWVVTIVFGIWFYYMSLPNRE
jgi:hypothetical protein